MLTAKECLQSAEVCLALAHKTKNLDTRAALPEFAYEFRIVAKRLERDECKLMVRAALDRERLPRRTSPGRAGLCSGSDKGTAPSRHTKQI